MENCPLNVTVTHADDTSSDVAGLGAIMGDVEEVKPSCTWRRSSSPRKCWSVLRTGWKTSAACELPGTANFGTTMFPINGNTQVADIQIAVAFIHAWERC